MDKCQPHLQSGKSVYAVAVASFTRSGSTCKRHWFYSHEPQKRKTISVNSACERRVQGSLFLEERIPLAGQKAWTEFFLFLVTLLLQGRT